jgi:hypothetical protein
MIVGWGVFEGMDSVKVPGVLQAAVKTWIRMLVRIMAVKKRDLLSWLPPEKIIPVLNTPGNPDLIQSVVCWRERR